MGNKIFVSYKYADEDVAPLLGVDGTTTVRSYVDALEEFFDNKTDHIYKGESDGEDLSELSEDQIWTKLKDRIFDSSVTIVMISPNMREPGRSDKSQWIPWEISYSLRETTRNDRTSHSNAMIAVALPDSNGSYEYITRDCNKCASKCRIWYQDKMFKILGANIFNIKDQNPVKCADDVRVFSGEPSYIIPMRWGDFARDKASIDAVVSRALAIKDDIDSYEIKVEVKD